MGHSPAEPRCGAPASIATDPFWTRNGQPVPPFEVAAQSPQTDWLLVDTEPS
jgi:hypothetical protein